jgi:hypothetical protein
MHEMEVKIETKKNHEKKKTKINLILSHVNHIFLILDPQIRPQAFRHNHCTFFLNVIFNVKKGPIQGSICFKLVPTLLVPGPLSKVALNMTSTHCCSPLNHLFISMLTLQNFINKHIIDLENVQGKKKNK